MDPKDQEERPAAALEKGIYSLLNPRQNYLNHTVAVYSLLFSLAIWIPQLKIVSITAAQIKPIISSYPSTDSSPTSSLSSIFMNKHN
jgi:hypothetical protein